MTVVLAGGGCDIVAVVLREAPDSPLVPGHSQSPVKYTVVFRLTFPVYSGSQAQVRSACRGDGLGDQQVFTLFCGPENLQWKASVLRSTLLSSLGQCCRQSTVVKEHGI